MNATQLVHASRQNETSASWYGTRQSFQPSYTRILRGELVLRFEATALFLRFQAVILLYLRAVRKQNLRSTALGREEVLHSSW